jgi:hypothetical protein
VKRQERVVLLFDFLVAHPERVTMKQIMAHTRWAKSVTKQAIRDLRLSMGDQDTINLVCDPDPSQPRGQYLYGLVGTVEKSRAWQTTRLLDTESRIETQLAVASSISAGTDGRSRDGKRARLIKKALGRLLEDLRELSLD